ncbi:hypothetical protein KRR38_34215 [Novosphingobium sp. G106]|nr:hypothetical protein [Novosphingobium sp. G106]MBV1692555.1 hypothetical protein [Novosphingobium sp. G106]
MTWRRFIWTLVALTAAYVVMLMLVTPTPGLSGHEPGILDHLLPGSWLG